jgi:hypothetical protein
MVALNFRGSLASASKVDFSPVQAFPTLAALRIRPTPGETGDALAAFDKVLLQPWRLRLRVAYLVVSFCLAGLGRS